MSDLSPFPTVNHTIYHRLISQKCTSNTRLYLRSDRSARYTHIKLKSSHAITDKLCPNSQLHMSRAICTWLFSAHSQVISLPIHLIVQCQRHCITLKRSRLWVMKQKKAQKWSNYAGQKLLLKHLSRNTQNNFDKGNWLDLRFSQECLWTVQPSSLLGVMSCSPAEVQHFRLMSVDFYSFTTHNKALFSKITDLTKIWIVQVHNV